MNGLSLHFAIPYNQLGSSIAHVVSKHFGEDGKAIRGKWKKLYPWQSFPKIEILFADVVCGT